MPALPLLLPRYSSYPEKGSKTTRISQLEVLDVDWDDELGSNLIDATLARHFAEKFAEKNKIEAEEVLGSSKAMAKMKKQVGGQEEGGGRREGRRRVRGRGERSAGIV